jgi:hypothetical protein
MEAPMINPVPDQRSPTRKHLDEQIAAEPPLAPPVLPAGAGPTPLEVHLNKYPRPLAIAGVVENGLVRLLDPDMKLPEHSRVIIVATQ